MEIVKLKGEDFGIEETKAQEIAGQFKPMLDKMVELEKEYNRIIKLPRDREDTAEKAKELRQKLVKVRTGTAEIHKAQKAFYLAGGRFVDAWKNAQLFASEGLEAKLLEIETYRQRQELEIQNKRQADREDLLRPYYSDFEGLNLGAMQADVWDAYYEKKKRDFEDLKRAEEEAENRRLETLERQKLHNDRWSKIKPYFEFISMNLPEDLSVISDEEFTCVMNDLMLEKAEADRKTLLYQGRDLELRPYANFIDWFTLDLLNISDDAYQEVLANAMKAKADFDTKLEEQAIENARLRLEAELKEKIRIERSDLLSPYIVFIRDYNKMISLPEVEFQKEFSDVKRGAQDHWEFERKQAIERQEAEERQKAKTQKLEAELKAKREAEAKAEADRKAKELKDKKEAEALAKAGDQAILKNWIESFSISALKLGNLTHESVEKAEEITDKFISFKEWALKQIEK